jgi:UDP-glucose 4-epimerase
MNRIHSGEGIKIWGDGSVQRDYVYVTDVARACLLALESDVQGVFNIGSGTGYSLNEIVKMLESVTGIPIQPEYLAGRAYDVPRIVLDCQKAARTLGWKPEVDMASGLEACWRWLSEQ